MTYEEDHFSFLQKLYFFFARHWLSDKRYAEWMLYRKMGGGSIDRPRTLNEKIQWLKLYNRQPEYMSLPDKYLVREYVESKVGAQYLNTLYGVYEHPDQIDYAKLPECFVIKATHGCGMNVLIYKKSAVDFKKLNKKLAGWLKLNYYSLGREWVYKNIQPRLICEKLLLDEAGNIPNDFKVCCFNGNPKYIQVDIGRFCTHTRAFYDTRWEKLPFGSVYPLHQQGIERPAALEEILWISEQLSQNMPFVRVDLYALPRPVFGEMTFYPANGFEHFFPKEWDLKLGELLQLPRDM